MRRCIELAGNGEGYVAPNPLVGCVIVQDGRIIGEGYHRQYGEAHAEVNAIASVSDPALLKTSTLYVSLEPCSHWGKTPPCADLIISKGIPRVVVGMVDPYAEVAGNGIRKLREAGIEVEVGILENECRELNRKFITVQEKKRPYVTLKWAQTVDGYLDNNRPANVPATWMTGPVAKTLVHRLRAQSASILAGTNTIQRDNPSLSVRESAGPNPLRVILDRTLRLNPESRVFDGEAPILVITDSLNASAATQRYPRCEIVEINFSGSVPEQVLRLLYDRKIQSLFVEGGEQTLRSFIEADVWDEGYVFISSLRVADLAGGTANEPLGTRAPEIPGKTVEEKTIDGVKLIRTTARRSGK